jgi:hypothetical protein
MKRFIVSALCISLFFLGLGALIEKVGARLKSDEKALALIKAARAAIGGDDAIAGVQSLRIKGTTTHTFKLDGAERTENGETEIAMQLPDKLSKMVKIGRDDGSPSEENLVQRRSEVIVVTKDKDGNAIVGSGNGSGTGIGTEPGKRIIITKDSDLPAEIKTEGGDRIIVRKGDGDLPMKVEAGRAQSVRINRQEMEAHHRQARQNELFRLTLGLLLSPPAALAVNYAFGGETTVDNKPCNLVVAEVGGSSVKLYLDRSTNLPVMMSYMGEQMPMILHFTKEAPVPANGGDKDVMFFRKADGPEATTEFQVRFDDYRSEGGVQLPYRWTTTAGDMREVFDVTSYEVNPSNISDSFDRQKLEVRVKKDDQ